MQVPNPSLSIVVPIYNEQRILPELRQRLQAALDRLDFATAEVLLVDDGSTDDSAALIAQIVAQDERFKGILLSRNFGHQAALSIGLGEASGTLVVMMDGDLQDPPEAIADLVAAVQQGADVAYGVRRGRKESWLKRLAYYCYYRTLRQVSNVEIPLDAGDFCCLRREVVEALLSLPERKRFLRGLRAWVGFRHVGVEYERAARHGGRPSYTLRKLVELAYDGLFSFSNLPIRLMQLIGFAVSILSLLVACIYLVRYLLAPAGAHPQGFTTLVISIWFLAGVQLFCAGIVGEYVVRISDESRRRPIAFIRRRVIHHGTGPATSAMPYSPEASGGGSVPVERSA